MQTSYNRVFTQAFAGMLSDPGPHRIETFLNDEATDIPAGIFVGEEAGTAGGQKAKLLVSTTYPVAGVVVNSAARNPGDIATAALSGTAAIRAGKQFNVMAEGAVWVLCEEVVAVGDTVYARHTANGPLTQKGAIRNDSDSSNCVEVKGARIIDAGTSNAGGTGCALVVFSRAANH
jgi:hypothetical protein